MQMDQANSDQKNIQSEPDDIQLYENNYQFYSY